MNLQIHFFGMIAETLKKEQLIIDNYQGNTLGDVEEMLKDNFPELGGFTYKLALNKKMVNKETALEKENEIAVLPPFAGG